MAEEEKENVEQEEGKSEKSSNKMLMIIIIVVLLLIILIGVVATILLLGDDEEDATAQQAPAAKVQQAPSQPKRSYTSNSMEPVRKLNEIGVLYPLDTFTVNLKSDSGRRYLKVTMDLELSGQELTAELDNKTAVIRDRIIRILTSKTLEEVTSRKGKDKLTQQIKDALNAMLVDGQILGVYFTEFVIQ